MVLRVATWVYDWDVCSIVENDHNEEGYATGVISPIWMWTYHLESLSRSSYSSQQSFRVSAPYPQSIPNNSTTNLQTHSTSNSFLWSTHAPFQDNDGDAPIPCNLIGRSIPRFKSLHSPSSAPLLTSMSEIPPSLPHARVLCASCGVLKGIDAFVNPSTHARVPYCRNCMNSNKYCVWRVCEHNCLDRLWEHSREGY